MLKTKLANIKIAGISCTVPRREVNIEDFKLPDIEEKEILKIALNTGVTRRHIADNNTCTSDLCYYAARNLLEILNVKSSELNLIVFVSQTPDYILPATAYSLHERLECSKATACFDINMGCSGYVYGLWIAGSLLSKYKLGKALLLVGDTISKLVSPSDKSTTLLFGDAGSATVLEYSDETDEITFCIGSDGSGVNNLIVESGAFRKIEYANMEKDQQSMGSKSGRYLFMNGPEVFAFTLREIPPLIKELAPENDKVDYFIFYKANKFVINHLVNKLMIPAEKVPFSIERYGNTSGALIPLTIVDRLMVLSERKLDIVLAVLGLVILGRDAGLELDL